MGKRLVLWDIDKTLLDVDAVGADSFAAAFTEFTGLERFVTTHGPGRTEWQWFRDTCEANGLDDPGDWFPRFRDLQTRELRRRTAEMCERGRVLAGAREVLHRCAEDPDIVPSLLTGNSAANARLKLEVFDLARYVEFEWGAYGDDHPERAELVSIARRRVRRHSGVHFTADTTVLVGDSPNDVTAALVGGAKILAVATGLVDAAGLSAAGAPAVLPDLSDADEVMALLRA